MNWIQDLRPNEVYLPFPKSDQRYRVGMDWGGIIDYPRQTLLGKIWLNRAP